MVPDGLLYTKDHEWIKIEGRTATVGITDHAQQALGEITFIELPAEGKAVDTHGELAVVESSKAASDIYAPLAGTVTQVNDQLESQPELITNEAYGAGWICKMELTEPTATDDLMDAAAYTEYLNTL